jgi:murein DD-endopeptidase MepM/ murein hydrolase activator NlpD
LAVQTAIATARIHRSRAFIDLGQEQPIDTGPRRIDAQDRRHVSLQWLIGAVLAGSCGAALIGSALYLGLDRQSNFAQAPEIAVASRHEGSEESGMNPGKGDRLVRPVDIVAAKQTFKAPTTIRVGDKEVVKIRPFTHVATTLTLTPTGFADAVPEFNPMKLTSDAAAQPDAPPDPGPVQDDAEVAFSTRDFTGADAGAISGELTQAEAQAQVVESIRAAAAAGAKAAPPLPAQMLLKRTSGAGLDPLGGLAYATTGNVSASAPFSSIEVHMVAENVTNAPRSQPAEGPSGGERLVVVRHGEAIEDILRANGAAKEAIVAIVAAFGGRRGDPLVSEGQKIILQYDEPTATGQIGKIGRLSVYTDEQLKATIAINDFGDYVAVSMPASSARKTARNDDEGSGGMNLYESFFETALKQGIPRPIIDEMVKVFANDVDFQRGVSAGDSVDAFYSEPDEIDPRAELLYATVTSHDQIFKYYRFETPDDGLVDYYDENGRSVRKFLIRKPIAAGELRSGFGMRYHPILHYARMHTGVDWSNAIGTPILAAGNGSIIKAEFTQGYGRRVEIQHANGYVTTYSHMSGFARGIAPGVRVTQGQVIGYLGQSGLATGPHLHYEVIVNAHFVDPMAIKLARTREFDGKLLSAFKRERERIDQLLAQAPNATPTPQKINVSSQ